MSTHVRPSICLILPVLCGDINKYGGHYLRTKYAISDSYDSYDFYFLRDFDNRFTIIKPIKIYANEMGTVTSLSDYTRMVLVEMNIKRQALISLIS